MKVLDRTLLFGALVLGLHSSLSAQSIEAPSDWKFENADKPKKEK
ncbi:hypothetical protein [Bergeyella sp. RCAD1439]|nr:hypothetical protein [Bergeyella sp. RCAD1439]